MDLSKESLVAIRSHLEAARGEAALRRLALALVGDRRRGAQALGLAAERRLFEQRRERRRMAKLFALRRRLFRDGVRRVAGVDEVGVGPLAGPVVACAVVLPERVELLGLDDSKRLSPGAREELALRIREQALAVAVAAVSVREIDRINIYRASLEAMRRAVARLELAPDHVLVDARTIPGLTAPQTPIVHGDALDGSIAAASVVAKVHRDALMERLHARYPGYGFARHKGYATRRHLDALRRLGPTPAHRRSFSPVVQQSLW
jgi:ribonuclease HII